MDYIKYKELESKIFGIRIGQIRINSSEDIKNFSYIPFANNYANNKDSLGYDLIDIRIPYQVTSYVKDVQMHNNIYVGSIVTYELDVNSSEIINRNLYVTKSCRLATSEDLEECINIAKESFVELEDGVNRFNLDPNFKKEDIKKYYIEWVKNIFNKTSADEVIVYDDESVIKGFISTKRINNSEYNIPLNAVKRSERGKGIYKEMVYYTIDKLREDNVNINIRAYLGNVALQNTWLSLGAHIKEIEYIFHGGMYGK